MPIVLSREWDLAAIYRLVWVLKSVLVKLFILWIFKATGETAIKRYLFDLNERWTGLKAHFELSLWIKTAIMCDECVCVCCAYACAYCCCYECFFSLNFHSLLMLMVMLWNGVPFINHTCEYIIRTMVWHAFHFIFFALLLWFPFSLSLFCHLFNFKSNQIVFLHIHKPATSSPTHSLNFKRWCIFSLFKSSIFPSFITHFESNIIDDSAKMQLIDTPHFMDSFIWYYIQKKSTAFSSFHRSETIYFLWFFQEFLLLATSYIPHVACV